MEIKENLKTILGNKEDWLKAMRLLNPDAQISDDSYDATIKAILKLFDDALIQKERIVRAKLLKRIEDVIGEFSDNPDECLGIISDFVERRLYLLRNGHSIDADGNCNMGCC